MHILPNGDIAANQSDNMPAENKRERPKGYFVAWAEGVGGWLWGTYCDDANEYSVGGRCTTRDDAIAACWRQEGNAKAP